METCVVLRDPAGLHARPAAAVASVAARCGGSVTVSYAGRTADARSVLELLTLGALPGAQVVVRAEGAAPATLEEVVAALNAEAPADGPDQPTAADPSDPAAGTTSATDAAGDTDPDDAYPLWSPRLVCRLTEAEDRFAVIRALGARMIELGAIDEDYLTATLKREASQPTGVPAEPPFGIAHSEAEGAHRLSLALGVLERPVPFGRMDDPDEQLDVRLVGLLAVPGRARHVPALLSVIGMLTDPELTTSLLAAPDDAAMWRVLVDAGTELVPQDPAGASPAGEGSGDQRRLVGVAASPGVAVAPALVLCDGADDDGVTDTDPEAESARLVAALDAAGRRWSAEADEATGEDTEILRMYAAVAADPSLGKAAAEHVRSGSTAAQALRRAGDQQAAILEQAQSEYLAARADDIRGVVRAVIRSLTGSGDVAASGPVVVVGQALTVLDLPRDAEVVAVVDVAGSVTSHLAMVARGRGIPAIFGLGPAHLALLGQGRQLAVNGWTGQVEIDPEEPDIARLRDEDTERRAACAAEAAASREITGTLDGTRVEFAVNAAGIDEIRAAIAAGADGIGLLRTEFAFAERRSVPSLEDQQAFFAAAIEAAAGRRLVVRTFDFGTDKPARFMRTRHEENPALGVRGIRIVDEYLAVIRDQLVALARAARAADRAHVAVMAPMIATVEEARAFRDLAREADPEGRLEVGIMVEVPSVVFLAAEIAEFVDFFSIGTNDLTQYLHAADRLNPAVARLHDPSAVAVVRAVAAVCDAAARAGIWVGVCGEAASCPEWAHIAVGLGVTELSVRLDRLPRVRSAIGTITSEQARSAAQAAVQRF